MRIAKSMLVFLLSTHMLAPCVAAATPSQVIIDAGTGRVIQKKNATEKWFPGSLTKLMTLYMTFDAAKSGQIDLTDNLTVSTRAAHQPKSKLGLMRGEKITIKQAVLAVITQSANDAAVALAEHLDGTEGRFASQMTQKAHSLGMRSTYFRNATGFHNTEQVTTARDIAILAWKTKRDFPDYYSLFSVHNFTYKGRKLHTINKFTTSYRGADGMTNAHSCASGYSLTASAKRHDKQLIGVVMGAATSHERYQLMTKQMNDGFAGRNEQQVNENIGALPAALLDSPTYQSHCNYKERAAGLAVNKDRRYSHLTDNHKPHTQHVQPKKVIAIKTKENNIKVRGEAKKHSSKTRQARQSLK